MADIIILGWGRANPFEERKAFALDLIRHLPNKKVFMTRNHPSRASAARYRANAVSTVEMIQELINLVNDISGTRLRTQATGRPQDGVAFYDSLAVNQRAVEVVGDTSLRVIAHGF